MEVDYKTYLNGIFSQIEEAAQISTLSTIHDQMAKVAIDWSKQGIKSTEIISMLNQWHDHLIASTIRLVLTEMEDDGLGKPPTAYCWMLLGSAGRREQTLNPDQDNALVYLDPSSEVKPFFKIFSERVVAHLAEVGYPYCTGFLMATNPRWNLSYKDWLWKVEEYLSYPNWDNARFLMMVGDIRPISGDFQLVYKLRSAFYEKMKNASYVMWQVADHTDAKRIPLNIWNRLVVEKWGDHQGEINIKEGGYLQIVSLVRLWAMEYDLSAFGTVERIRQLKDHHIWKEDFANQVLDAFQIFVGYRLWNNYVNPSNLSENEILLLKESLKTVKSLYKISIDHFRKPK